MTEIYTQRGPEPKGDVGPYSDKTWRPTLQLACKTVTATPLMRIYLPMCKHWFAPYLYVPSFGIKRHCFEILCVFFGMEKNVSILYYYCIYLSQYRVRPYRDRLISVIGHKRNKYIRYRHQS